MWFFILSIRRAPGQIIFPERQAKPAITPERGRITWPRRHHP